MDIQVSDPDSMHHPPTLAAVVLSALRDRQAYVNGRAMQDNDLDDAPPQQDQQENLQQPPHRCVDVNIADEVINAQNTRQKVRQCLKYAVVGVPNADRNRQQPQPEPRVPNHVLCLILQRP